MDLRHLRYFVAVAEEGHITRAAERLGIQQPPLSQQIKALEAELDTPLFRRLPRGVELTDAGKALLPEARQIMAQVEGALAKAKRTGRGEEGAIAVGFTSSAPFHPAVPRIIRRYRDAFPGVELMLEEAGTAEMAQAIREERLDLAFIRSPLEDQAGLSLYPLASEPMILAAPEGHPLARDRRPLPLTRLRGEPLVLYRRQAGQGLFESIMAACRAAGFEPEIAQEAPRIVSTLNLVAAGLGVTLAPQSLRQLGMEGVVFRPLEETPELTAKIWLASRTTTHSAAVRAFVALARRLVRVG
ncbi:MAG: LysR family transcriptional regulator [Rhodospirillales bacterium]